MMVRWFAEKVSLPPLNLVIKMTIKLNFVNSSNIRVNIIMATWSLVWVFDWNDFPNIYFVGNKVFP